MLFWLTLILLVVSIVLTFALSAIEDKCGYSSKAWKRVASSFCAWFYTVFIVISAFLGIALIIMLCVIGANNLCGVGFVEENKQCYEALLYKAQTAEIRDEFGIVNKSYIDDVQKWNEEVAKNKAYSQSKWVGIFYPEKYYGCWEAIDLNKIKMKE